MRPSLLDPLFARLTSLQGIGPKLEKLFARLLDREEHGARVIDALCHLPTGAIDRRNQPTLRDVVADSIVTVRVRVDQHRPAPPGRSRAPHLIYVGDDTGAMVVTYFHGNARRLEQQFPIGEWRTVSGTVALYDGMLQMVHPDRIVSDEDLAEMPPVDPIYPLTEGLGPTPVGRAVGGALAKMPELPEWQDATWLRQRGWPSMRMAFATIHKPQAPADVDPASPAWSRLAYDELLASQFALALVRAQMRRPAGRRIAGDGRLRAKVIAGLPYALTGSQARAVEEIVTDLGASQRMLRLLQGDVGSGKTVVALLAAASVIEAGKQAALMAPTELLARQHYATIAPLAERAGVSVALLTGRERGAERKQILAGLASGDLAMVVGTHALFQDEVAFAALALAIVDEQHRFGVHQRLALTRKGDAVDVLVLTATPIPRTLVLSYFGDMDVSQLREKPPGRQPIDTRAVPLSRLEEIVDAVGRAIDGGQRVYWVCPLVTESEDSDLAAADARFAFLKARFGNAVDLVHGQMRGSEKDAAMARFASGQSRILVATTVIEVGVDVPEATVMVVEHAERFGLAQLHQLRGRVGRGSGRSTCLLLYRAPLGETAKARLAIMRETEDGFRIAEEDLRLRGEGDVLGTRQSGMPGFRIARLDVHGALIEAARDDAQLMLQRDAQLATERGKALRHLLYFFERDEAIRMLRAG